ncbi:MAG: GNAT family N-acetyltransferase [Lachnospiraceae bacterium]|nr:GNAT family N-acetyltransferase [Lachnospiraceae bacterium]
MNTVFETENIKFIELTESLVEDYLAMINDINVARLLGRTKTVTEEGELNWIRMNLENKAPVFSMIEKSSGKFIGNIEFMDVHDEEAELGITITASMQDKGYGTESVPAIVDYGMKELNLKRIFLKVFPDNLRAIHVYEKCGFREYGRTEEDVLMEIMITDDNKL